MRERDGERRGRGSRPVRLLYVLTLSLCLLIAVYVYFAGVEHGYFETAYSAFPPSAGGALDLAPESGRRSIASLEASDERLMRRQRGVVDELARRHVGTPVAGGKLDDLRILQELLDQRVVPSDEIYQLQALGVVLGDVMAEQLGFSWVIVEDELGRSRALRFGDTDALVFPVTMISKRVERDIRFTVDELYKKAEEIAAGGGARPTSRR
jgi:hypothetical protein